jgi:hypothetical protein
VLLGFTNSIQTKSKIFHLAQSPSHDYHFPAPIVKMQCYNDCRNALLSIFPTEVSGIASMKKTSLGTLQGDMLSLQNAINAASGLCLEQQDQCTVTLGQEGNQGVRRGRR